MKNLVLLLLIFVSSISLSENLENIPFKNQKNEIKTIKDYKGKTYVKLWASWCPICLVTMDHTLELSKDKNKDFNVITIVSPGYRREMNEASFRKWFSGTDWTELDTLMDSQNITVKRTKTRGYPTNLFLDSKGEIARVVYGPLSNEQIKQEMSKIK